MTRSATGAVDAILFAEMLVAVVLTTIVAPYLLAWAAPKAAAETAAFEALQAAGTGST